MRICMQCGQANDSDGLLCLACRADAQIMPEIAIARLAQNNAARQVIIEQMAKRINELEAMIFIEHDDRPADYIQPESLPLGSHYEYVEGCKP